MKKEYIIPIFVPHLGCPNHCSFCNQKKISGQEKMVTAEDVKNTIEYYLKNFKDNPKYVEVAFFGGSFTAIEKGKQEELLSAANEYIQTKKVNSIRISTRPDCVDREILKMLKKYHVKTIELGVQSTNNYILARCKRGHSYEDVIKASRLIRLYGFTLGHQIMVGLPDSTKKDEIQTTMDCIKLKPKLVRIYPVLVIKDTPLAEEYEKGEYIPLSVGQAVERCKEMIYMFNKKHIEVIRVGLQNTESITDPTSNKSDVISGPYHPAFGQLVEDSIWYDALIAKIKKYNTTVKNIEIEANPMDVNQIIGHKRENITKIKETYDVEISVKVNDQIKTGKFKMKIVETIS